MRHARDAVGQQELLESRPCCSLCRVLDEFDADLGGASRARQCRGRQSQSGQRLGEGRACQIEAGEIHVAFRLPQMLDPRVVDGGDAGAAAVSEEEGSGTGGGLPQSFGQLIGGSGSEHPHEPTSLTQSHQGFCHVCRDRRLGTPQDDRLEPPVQFRWQRREAAPGSLGGPVAPTRRSVGAHAIGSPVWACPAPWPSRSRVSSDPPNVVSAPLAALSDSGSK